MEKNYSESININMGPVQINGTLISYDENLLKELHIFRNGIDFMLKLYGYNGEEKADANFPKLVDDKAFEHVPENLYGDSKDNFYGYDKEWLDKNIVARYGNNMLYAMLFSIKDEFKYPNLFFDKTNDGKYALRFVALITFWEGLLRDTVNEMDKRNISLDDTVNLFHLAKSKLHEIESKIDHLFKELKRKSEGYDFINVSTLTKRLDLFKNQYKLSTIYDKLSFYEKIYPTDLQNRYKEAKIRNTSGKEAPIYFIKTEDIDKVFEMIVSEPFGNKTFFKDVFGFRTRFIGDAI